MNRIVVLILLVVPATCISMADDDQYQVFSDAQGREIEARIVKYDPGTNKITIQLKNGRRSTVDLSIFSEAAQIKVKDWHMSEELLSPRKLVVKIAKKRIRSGSYHEKRNGWQSHYPGVKFEEMAFEVELNNKGGHILEDVIVDYCIFYENRHTKRRHGESELQELSDGSSGWCSTSESSKENKEVVLRKREQFVIESLPSRGALETLTESVQLRDGTEGLYGETSGDTRSYRIRQVEDELSGIIIRISVPLPSGKIARKEYAYPSDFLKKEHVDWSKQIEDSADDVNDGSLAVALGDDEKKILQQINTYIREKKFANAESLCRHLYNNGVECQYHGAWRLGSIYLSFENPDRNIDLGEEWMLKASGGGFAGPYSDLAKFYACDPDPSMRDGKKAVMYARRMMKIYSTPSPGAYEIMACALARDGQYSKAVEKMQKAIAAMEKRRGEKLHSGDEYLRKMDQFSNNKAWPN